MRLSLLAIILGVLGLFPKEILARNFNHQAWLKGSKEIRTDMIQSLCQDLDLESLFKGKSIAEAEKYLGKPDSQGPYKGKSDSKNRSYCSACASQVTYGTYPGAVIYADKSGMIVKIDCEW